MKIEVYHSKILIKGYHLGDIPLLETSLSVWDPIYYRYNEIFYTYNEFEEILEIPSGVNLDIYQVRLSELGWNGEFINKKGRLSKVKKFPTIKVSPRNDMQKRAIKFLTDRKPYDFTWQKILALPTGEGKTYCSISSAIKLNAIPLIFVDQENIGNQWIEAILKFTNTTIDEIIFISGMESIEKILSMSKEEIENIKFFIGIHRTFSILYEDEVVFREFIKKTKISLKIFDEAHTEWKNIFQMDLLINSPSWYVTATPSRSNYIEDKVFKTMYGNIDMLKPENKNKYLNILIFKINSNPTLEDQKKLKTKYGFDGNSFSKLLEEKDHKLYLNSIVKILFGMIYDFKNKEPQEIKKTAIIFHLNSTVDLFYNLLKKVIEKNNLPHTIGILNGLTKKEDKENLLKNTDIIITTGKTFTKALDVENLHCIINTVPFSSQTMTEQMIGRLRFIEGKDLFFFDIVNVGYEQCKKQLTFKKKIYNKKALEVRELNEK